jgi:hypothetical protein
MFQFSGKRTTLFHQTPLCGDHFRLSWCPKSLDHYTSTVSIKQSSLSIEAVSYKNYQDMNDRVLNAVAAAYKVIDSDLFTRVGLRYINVIDIGEIQ